MSWELLYTDTASFDSSCDDSYDVMELIGFTFYKDNHTVVWKSVSHLPDFLFLFMFVTLNCFRSSKKLYIRQR